jgi:hypothetical protein
MTQAQLITLGYKYERATGAKAAALTIDTRRVMNLNILIVFVI